MSYPDPNGLSSVDAPGEAEASLRLIASLPAPEGLEDRVHAALLAAPRNSRILAWPVSRTGDWLRAAAAAAIVFVVAGGGWGIYSHVQPGQAFPAIAGHRSGAPGGFSEGGAVRRPQTLVGPTVKPPVLPGPPKETSPAKPVPTPSPAPRSASGTKSNAPSASAPVK